MRASKSCWRAPESFVMTQTQVFVELERFRQMIEQLSKRLPKDEDFWPAYAERANALEACCPLELRDYARESILRTVHVVKDSRGSRA